MCCTLLPASGVTIARKSATVSFGLSQPQNKQRTTISQEGEVWDTETQRGDFETKAAWRVQKFADSFK